MVVTRTKINVIKRKKSCEEILRECDHWATRNHINQTNNLIPAYT